MGVIAEVQQSTTESIWAGVADAVKGAANLEQAASAFLNGIYEQFDASFALARVFVTVPYKDLPQRNRDWVAALAEDKGVSADLTDETPVLSLVATRGKEEAWNDIRKSEGHVGIPLVSEAFVSAIPMVARLLQDLGIVANLVGDPGSIDLQKVSSTTETFHVPDASETLDQEDRKIIPNQDFVGENGVVTVFGIGGPYATGGRDVAVAIFFTKESLPRDVVKQFEGAMENFKNATVSLVNSNKIFAS